MAIGLLWVIPVAVAAAALVLEYSGLDLVLSSAFFDRRTGVWPYRESRLFSDLLHDRGRDLSISLYLALLAAWLVCVIARPLAGWRRPLLFLLVASASGPLVVNLLKALTHIQIPWNLTLFGGDLPYVRLLDSVAPGTPVGHGFPGGHSSGGFAWVSVYFLMREYRHPWRGRALAVALGAGFLFSATQVVRGAHFPSHDLVSLVLCWSASLAWTALFFPRRISAGLPSVPRARLRAKKKNFKIH